MKKVIKSSALVLTGSFLFFLFLAVATSPVSRACPNLTLVSPPSTLKMCSGTCNGTNVCNRSCENSLTLSNVSDPCDPYTWTFTNNTTGCVTVFVTTYTSATLNFMLRGGSAGDSITLVISAPGATSATYNFTAVSC